MTLYLKGHQKYNRSKLKVLDLLNRNRTFNFDQLYFWCPLRYRVIQYLVWKLSLIVKLNFESLGMATSLDSVTCYSKPYFSTKIEFAWFVLGTIVVSAYFFLIFALKGTRTYVSYLFENLHLINLSLGPNIEGCWSILKSANS